MGSSQEGPGASLSEVRDRGMCRGAWSLAVWGLASQQVQVTSDAEAGLEGGWREGVAQGPESTGEKFGAYPDLRPGQGCQLGWDKTLVVRRARWGVCVCVKTALESGPSLRWLCIRPGKRWWQLGWGMVTGR